MKKHQERLNTLTRRKPKDALGGLGGLSSGGVGDGGATTKVGSGLTTSEVDGEAVKPMVRSGKWVYGKGFVVDGAASKPATPPPPALNTIEGQFEEMRRKRSEAGFMGT